MSDEGWSEVVDDSTGDTYYYNERTGESQWEKPDGFGVEVESPISQPVAVGKSPWQKNFTDEGDVYYFNEDTGESQWEVPDDFVDESKEEEVGETKTTEEVVLDDDNNPVNWEELYDDSSQSHYYYNSVTQDTRWDKPPCLLQPNEDGSADVNLENSQDAADNDARSQESLDPFATGSTATKKSEEVHDSDNYNKEDDDDAQTNFKLLDNDVSFKKSGKGHGGRSSGIISLFTKEESLESGSVRRGSQQGKGDDESKDGSVQNTAFPVQQGRPEDNMDMKETALGVDINVPVVDVTTVQWNAELNAFVSLLEDVCFEQFAEKHFQALEGKSPIKRRSTVRKAADGSIYYQELKDHDKNAKLDDSGKVVPPPEESCLRWSAVPLESSLCMMNESDLSNRASDMNELILAYMGDTLSSFQSKKESVLGILKECFRAPTRFRDEVYCQIVKQLRDNPSITSEERGWHLILICLSSFPPSYYLAPHLMAFFLQVTTRPGASYPQQTLMENTALKDKGLSVQDSVLPAHQVEIYHKRDESRRLAELCLRFTIRSVAVAPRLHPPTPIEVTSLITGDPLQVSIHLPDQTTRQYNVDSWMNVESLKEMVEKDIGIRIDNRRMFGMKEVDLLKGDDNTLEVEERVCDVLSFHYHDTFERVGPPVRKESKDKSDDSNNHNHKDKGKEKSKKEFSREVYRIIYTPTLFFDAIPHGAAVTNEDPVCTHLLYAQGIQDVLKGKYPVSWHDATVLSAIQLQEKFGDRVKPKKSIQQNKAVHGDFTSMDLSDYVGHTMMNEIDTHPSTDMPITLESCEESVQLNLSGNGLFTDLQQVNYSISNILSNRYSGTGVFIDETRRNSAEAAIDKAYMKITGLDEETSRISYLTVLRGNPFYGASFYVATKVSNMNHFKGNVIVAVSCSKLSFVNIETMLIITEYYIRDIETWGFSDDSVVIDLNINEDSIESVYMARNAANNDKNKKEHVAMDSIVDGEIERFFVESEYADLIANLISEYSNYLIGVDDINS